MKIIPTEFSGLFLIQLEKISDERGFFARSFCQEEFKKAGIDDFKIAQSSISFNENSGTLRGMHFQKSPHEEMKLISCIRGKIFDVVIDLRPNSQSFMKHFAIEMSQDSDLSLLVPEGFAHGFQTLEKHSMVSYQISEFYHPQSASGFRWDDPKFAIKWPNCSNRIISKKDQEYEFVK